MEPGRPVRAGPDEATYNPLLILLMADSCLVEIRAAQIETALRTLQLAAALPQFLRAVWTILPGVSRNWVRGNWACLYSISRNSIRCLRSRPRPAVSQFHLAL